MTITATSALASEADYLSFSTRAEFEQVMGSLDDHPGSVPVDEHLAAWEEQHQHSQSMRRHYWEQAQTGDTSECPVADIYFATVLSPKGVVKIGSYIFRIDAAAGVTYYIPATQKDELYSALIQDAPQHPAVRYFRSGEEALNLLEDGHQRRSAPVTVDSTAYVERCFDRSAFRDRDSKVNTYGTARIAGHLEYQRYAVYFSIIGKVTSTRRVFPSPFWLPYTTVLSGSMLSNFKPRCWAERGQPDSNPGVSAKRLAFRPWESTRGLAWYNVSASFAAPGSGTMNLHIEDY